MFEHPQTNIFKILSRLILISKNTQKSEKAELECFFTFGRRIALKEIQIMFIGYV